ncbi:MAG: putative lipid II flippase FtsW [Deltaproteobacteria bacterium]|nr:MAG: putative lipid II flippase FtsW [Deltaproteobacteria bacterium]
MKKETGKNRQGLQMAAYDLRLLFPVLFLVGIGIVMIYSSSSALALEKYKTDYNFLVKQGIFSAVGMVALVFCRHFPYRFYRSLVYPILVLSWLLLLAVLVTGLGHSAGGALRWLRFGFFSFQPSEFARFALIIYLAYSMSKKGSRLKEFSVGFLPHVLILGIFTALIMLQPDFGSAVMLAAVTWIMLFLGGVRLWHLGSALLVLLPAGYFIMINAHYRFVRLMSFMDPWQYPTDAGYQIVHSLMAFGTGGLWGTGIGKGYQKLFYLPEPHTDFIFSVIGEELGLVGVIAIIGLYIIIFWRGLTIARTTPDTFGMLVAAGFTISIGLQVCVNMGVTLGLLPTKGLSLPFLSYGGSSLLFNMASVGILMNIGASSGKRV